MKVRHKDLSEKQIIETLDALYTTAGSLKGRAAMKLFLRDLLTPSERIMLGRRILIARRLIAGAQYEDIVSSLRVSERTIGKVARWLEDQIPGYEQALKGMDQELKKRRIRHEDRKRFATLKQKYPLHFLLFPWPKGHKPKKQ